MSCVIIGLRRGGAVPKTGNDRAANKCRLQGVCIRRFADDVAQGVLVQAGHKVGRIAVGGGQSDRKV